MGVDLRARVADAISAPPAPREDADDMIDLDVHTFEGREIAVVTLNRPGQHNALSLSGWTGLSRIFSQELPARSALRAVVVRGAGDKAFSAGADISEFPAQRLTADQARRYNGAIGSALAGMSTLPVPVVAMIDGLAVGGGCELAAAADVRIVTANSRFGIPIGKLGVTLGLTETRAVSAALGRANLLYLLLSGRLIDARQAADWGFAQRVVGRDSLVEEVAGLLAAILDSSEVTVRAAKVTTNLSEDLGVGDDHPALALLHDQAYDGSDLKEGVAAFLQGRSPRFGGALQG